MSSISLLSSLPSDVIASEVFQAAITHRSASKKNNERLEFLGDAVLGLIIGHALYTRFSDANEGDLSRLRAYLVRKETLAAIALDNRLNDWLQLGSGEKKSGGFRRESILADGIEAIIGALYLLKGLQFTQEFVLQLYQSRLETLPSLDSLKDPKTRLQEYLQSQRMELPSYQIVAESDQGHHKTFEVECQVHALGKKTIGVGKSKRKAEQLAAHQMLAALGIAE